MGGSTLHTSPSTAASLLNFKKQAAIQQITLRPIQEYLQASGKDNKHLSADHAWDCRQREERLTAESAHCFNYRICFFFFAN